MCANLFIFSLSKTGVVCSHFEDVSKMKSGQMFEGEGSSSVEKDEEIKSFASLA